MDENNQRLLAELQEQNAVLRQQMAVLQRSHNLLQAVIEGTNDAVFAYSPALLPARLPNTLMSSSELVPSRFDP